MSTEAVNDVLLVMLVLGHDDKGHAPVLSLGFLRKETELHYCLFSTEHPRLARRSGKFKVTQDFS